MKHIDMENKEDIFNGLDELTDDILDSRQMFAGVKEGVESLAGVYSFNIESELFHRIDPELRDLWVKEIEQAYCAGGDCGIELARDERYDENILAAKKMLNFDEEIDKAYKCADRVQYSNGYRDAQEEMDLKLKNEFVEDNIADNDITQQIVESYIVSVVLGNNDYSDVTVAQLKDIATKAIKYGAKKQKEIDNGNK